MREPLNKEICATEYTQLLKANSETSIKKTRPVQNTCRPEQQELRANGREKSALLFLPNALRAQQNLFERKEETKIS